MLEGKRHVLTLNVASERDALAELALFNRDPRAYITARDVAKSQLRRQRAARVTPQDDALQELEGRMRAAQRSEKHIRDTRRYLNVWLAALRAKDLRTVGKAELERVLEAKCKPSQLSKRNKLIVALKSYTAMLKAKGMLDPAENPARWLDEEPPPPARVAAQRHHSAAVLERCYAAIAPLRRSGKGGPRPEPDQDQAVRDTMRLMVCYGMHHTEVRRLASCHPSTAARPHEHAFIKGVVSFWHQKKRAWHHISVDTAAWAAVQRLRGRRQAPGDGCMRKYLAQACRHGRCDRVLPARLRHSFVTLARAGGKKVFPGDAGLDLEDIAAITGHKSTATTETHYDANVVRPMGVIPINLVNPSDPAA